ncbi:unnamed protein product [Dovyalis caffra]|uniref:Uncharacterized protein n=1 Tax=Dovyalis caffra TaxID=77055 RepID=A0AAV1SGP5_9ROSI|nr:unnamed protein product [Dovyalis caffra]
MAKNLEQAITLSREELNGLRRLPQSQQNPSIIGSGSIAQKANFSLHVYDFRDVTLRRMIGDARNHVGLYHLEVQSDFVRQSHLGMSNPISSKADSCLSVSELKTESERSIMVWHYNRYSGESSSQSQPQEYRLFLESIDCTSKHPKLQIHLIHPKVLLPHLQVSNPNSNRN